MKKLTFITTLILSWISFNQNISAQTPLIDFQYWDTISFERDGFMSDVTHLEDINNHGVMVGWFVNEDGNTEAFVYYKNHKMLSYSHEGFTHTEFLGINDSGIVIGAAYDGTTNRTPIRIQLADPSLSTPEYNPNNVFANVLQSPAEEMFFGSVGIANRYPQKISNSNNYTIGTVSTTPISNRWLHYRNAFESTGGQLARYEVISPYASYPTYGSSMNNAGTKVCGFYIDGTNYKPYIYDMEDEDFIIDSSGLASLNRVKLKDINNDDYVAYTYRNTSGVWVAQISKLMYSYLSFSYYYETYEDFPFANTTVGSSCNAINDNNDVVGYYSMPSGRTVAFFAVTHDWEIPEFDYENDKFFFPNDSYYLTLHTNHWKDPYLNSKYGITDSPLMSLDYINYVTSLDAKNQKRLYELIPALPSTADMLAHTSTLPDRFNNLSPDFISYVTIRGEYNVYIDRKVKLSELRKFTKRTMPTFDGYCYGMVVSMLANQYDKNLLSNTFLGVFPLTPEEHAKDYTLNENLVRIIGTLHLNQYSNYEKTNFVNFYNEVKYNNDIVQSKKNLAMLARNMMSKETCRPLMKTSSSNTTGVVETYNHITLPYKVVRKLSPDLSKTDTVYAYDPNFDKPVKYNVLHNDALFIREYIFNEGLESYDMIPYGFFCHYGPNVKEISYFNPEVNDIEIHEKTSVGYCFEISNPYDIVIENLESGLTFEKIDDNIEFDMPIHFNYKFSGNNVPYSFNTSSTFASRTTITQSDGTYTFNLDYPDGTMSVSRIGTEPEQTDYIYNDEDYQRIENPDSDEKQYTLSTIYNPESDIESFVEINDLTLQEDDTITLINQDQYHFKLMNGNDAANNYRLRVRFLSEDEFFHINYESVDITATTNHIILLQPEDETRKVIILIDENQDGSIDDTLHLNPTSIYDNNFSPIADIHIYPNPSEDIFNVSVLNTQSPMTLQYDIVNILGRTLISEHVNINSGINNFKINLQSQPQGSYYFVLRNNNRFIHTEKIIKK